MLFVCALGSPTGRAQEAPAPQTLQSLISDSRLGDQVAVSVRDLRTGAELFSHRADVPMDPASNLKLVTALVALDVLGAGYRFETSAHGAIDPKGTVDKLVIKGGGDPSLDSEDALRLARLLYTRGVRRVKSLVLDTSAMEDAILAPGFDAQPQESRAFRAPLSALSINHNAFTLEVLPSPLVGGAVETSLQGKGAFHLTNQATTGVAGSPQTLSLTQQVVAGITELTLTGSLPVDLPITSRPVSIRRRVENPFAYAGQIFLEALRSARIRIPATVRRGSVGTLEVIARQRSEPLGELVKEVGKDSDNFTAEMILRALGASTTESRSASTVGGLQVVRQWLLSHGFDAATLENVSIRNGSGLFAPNRVTAQFLTSLMRTGARIPTVRTEYLAQLSIASVDGTLAGRFADLGVDAARVRAKTGTLNEVVTLSGYVLTEDPGGGVTFSCLANGVADRKNAARRLCDAVVGSLARTFR